MITTIPEVFTLSMTLIHIENTLVVAILEQHPSVTMVITFRPIAFIDKTSLY